MFSKLLTQQNFSSQVVTRENWGAYVVIDDFLKQSYFDNLCSEYSKLKSDKSIFTQENLGNVWRQDEENGKVFLIGSAGEKLDGFETISKKSTVWADFLSIIYSESSKSFFLDLFSQTTAFQKYVSKNDKINGEIGCKLSSQTNNFGDRIHQDTTTKVLSFLLYLEKDNWNEDSKGGTDLWEVTDQKVDYDESPNSIEKQLRAGKHSPKSHSLSYKESIKIKRFLTVDFKPNRLLGFIRTANSYHSVNPRILPENVTRDCLQINLWNFNRKSKFSYFQKVRNLTKRLTKNKL